MDVCPLITGRLVVLARGYVARLLSPSSLQRASLTSSSRQHIALFNGSLRDATTGENVRNSRSFSTGNWWVLTSGKLYEKRKRKVQVREKRKMERAQEKATGQRKLTKSELSFIQKNAGLQKKWGT